MFKKATKEKCKARVALCSVSGGGKTFTALRLASALGKKVAVIDSERGSASKYADQFTFDTCDDMPDFSPKSYIDAIQAAERGGYDVVIIDSLSHAWMGKGGALEMVDNAASRGGNSFAAWRNVTPWHNKLVDAILQSQVHIIATMRTKSDYVMEDKGGKSVPKKVGMAPIQRDGMEYEFDVVGDLDLDHNMTISKTRCPALDGKKFALPGEDVAAILIKWLNSGEAPKPPTIKKPEPPKDAEPPAKPSLGPSTDRATKAIDLFKAIGIDDVAMAEHVGKTPGGWTDTELNKLNRWYKEMKQKYDAENEAAIGAAGGQ